MINFTNFIKKREEKYSNIISDRVMSKEADKALEFVAEVFSNTLGPYAYHTILEDAQLHHIITKDGYSVYKNVVVYGRIGRAILGFIKKISGTVNEVVGDGTTSAVIIANELKRLKKLIKRYKVSPKTVSILLKHLTSIIINDIDAQYVKRIDIDNIGNTNFKEIIKRLATISLNNDIANGSLVSNIFCELSDPANGFINVDISKDSTTSYDADRGFEVYRGMIMSEMVTESDRRTCILQNPKILLVKGDIATNDIAGINHMIDVCVTKWRRPLVIFANSVSKTVTEIFRQSLIRNVENTGRQFPLLVVEMDTISVMGVDELMDMEAAIGATVIATEDGKNIDIYPEEYLLRIMGECEKIKATKYRTSIIRGKADEAKIKFRIDEIDSNIEVMRSEHHIDNRNNIIKQLRRKACLRSDMYTLLIGGQSLEEKEASAALFDDAVRGCQSAVKNGILPGCHITIPHHIRYNLLKDISVLYAQCAKYVSEPKKKVRRLIKAILKDIANSYENAYCKILQNKYKSKLKCKLIARKSIRDMQVYNLLTDKYEDKLSDIHPSNAKKYPNVINSADMDKHILRAATSIIDLIITSNQFARVPSRDEMIKNL